MSAAALDVSVIVCTRGRPEGLRRLLQSALALEPVPGLSWEILVVDNLGDPATAAVVAGFADVLPVRCVVEPEPGLSNARNRGLASAAGRHLCWTDDDVILDPAWLAGYARAFARFPEAALFGGPILPELEEPSPPWLAPVRDRWPLISVFAERRAEDYAPIAFAGGRTPYGANYAVRADVQRRFPYDPALGYAPGRARTGEESDVVYRMLKAGHEGWWTPESKVRHLITPDRQTLDYVRTYFRQLGGSAAYLRRVRPMDNYGELRRRALFSYLNVPALAALAAANRLAFGVAKGAGLTGPALGFLARQGFYEGVADECRAKGGGAG